ncbi:hypothetical protein GHW83_16825 [Salmonella enterica]|nr:hypothetical protein [Salmonella enterica]
MRGCNSSSQQYNGSSQEVNRQAYRPERAGTAFVPAGCASVLVAGTGERERWTGGTYHQCVAGFSFRLRGQ